MKSPLTPAGIEPATYRFVAQYLNHSATAVPILQMYYMITRTCSFAHNLRTKTVSYISYYCELTAKDWIRLSVSGIVEYIF